MKNSYNAIAAVVVGMTLASACSGDNETEAIGASAAASEGEPLSEADQQIAGRLLLLHDFALELDAPRYRRWMDAEIRRLGDLPASEVVRRTQLANMYGPARLDGLEPLLLAWADRVARAGSADERGDMTSALSALANKGFANAMPFPGFLVPIGRFDTRLRLNMRADAVRALFGHLAKPGASLPVADLRTLMHDRFDPCADLQPAAQSSSVVGAYEAGSLPQDGMMDRLMLGDAFLEDFCNGGQGNAGGQNAFGAMGAMNLTSCMEEVVQSARSDLAALAQDLSACMDSIRRGPAAAQHSPQRQPLGGLYDDDVNVGFINFVIDLTANDPASSSGSQALATAFVNAGSQASVELIRQAATLYGEKLARDSQQTAAALEARAQAAEALSTIKTNAAEIETLKTRLANTNAEIDATEKDIERLRFEKSRTTDPAQKERIDGQISDKHKKLKTLQEDKVRDEKRLNELRDEYKKAKAKLDGARVRATGASLPPEPTSAAEDPACQRLMANGMTFEELTQLAAQAGEVDDPLDLVINYDPTSDHGIEGALRALPCTADPANLGIGVACDRLTLCADPTQQCPCHDDHEDRQAEAEALVRESGVACAGTRCPEGQEPVMSGLQCVCVGGESPPGTPPPLPTLDTAMPGGPGVMRAFFGETGDSGIGRMIDDYTAW